MLHWWEVLVILMVVPMHVFIIVGEIKRHIRLRVNS